MQYSTSKFLMPIDRARMLMLICLPTQTLETPIFTAQEDACHCPGLFLAGTVLASKNAVNRFSWLHGLRLGLAIGHCFKVCRWQLSKQSCPLGTAFVGSLGEKNPWSGLFRGSNPPPTPGCRLNGHRIACWDDVSERCWRKGDDHFLFQV